VHFLRVTAAPCIQQQQQAVHIRPISSFWPPGVK
jgi:hypothetical protein